MESSRAGPSDRIDFAIPALELKPGDYGSA